MAIDDSAETEHSNGKVTLAILRNDLSNMNRMLQEWRAQDSETRRVIDQRMLALENRVLETEKTNAASVEDRTGLRRDVDSLGMRVTAWDLLNSIGGAVLAVFMIRKP